MPNATHLPPSFAAQNIGAREGFHAITLHCRSACENLYPVVFAVVFDAAYADLSEIFA